MCAITLVCVCVWWGLGDDFTDARGGGLCKLTVRVLDLRRGHGARRRETNGRCRSDGPSLPPPGALSAPSVFRARNNGPVEGQECLVCVYVEMEQNVFLLEGDGRW